MVAASESSGTLQPLVVVDEMDFDLVTNVDE